MATDDADIPAAWRDLIEALNLMARRRPNEVSPFNCSHDTLTVMVDPAEFMPNELARLDELGFKADPGNGTFYSFRYGSA